MANDKTSALKLADANKLSHYAKVKEEIMKRFVHICGTPKKCGCDYRFVEIAVEEAIRKTQEADKKEIKDINKSCDISEQFYLRDLEEQDKLIQELQSKIKGMEAQVKILSEGKDNYWKKGVTESKSETIRKVEKMIYKVYNKRFSSKIILVRNPYRKSKLDQYNIRALTLDNLLKFMNELKQQLKRL